MTARRCGSVRSIWGVATVALGLGALLGGAFGVALAVLAATVARKAMYWSVLRRVMGLRSDVFAPDLARADALGQA